MAANELFDLAIALEYQEPSTVGAAHHNSSIRDPSIRDLAANASAPKVLIKGSAAEAAWLVRMAKQFGIPVVEDNAAATALSELPLDEEIPEDLYRAVAVIIRGLDGPAR